MRPTAGATSTRSDVRDGKIGARILWKMDPTVDRSDGRGFPFEPAASARSYANQVHLADHRRGGCDRGPTRRTGKGPVGQGTSKARRHRHLPPPRRFLVKDIDHPPRIRCRLSAGAAAWAGRAIDAKTRQTSLWRLYCDPGAGASPATETWADDHDGVGKTGSAAASFWYTGAYDPATNLPVLRGSAKPTAVCSIFPNTARADNLYTNSTLAINRPTTGKDRLVFSSTRRNDAYEL